MIRKILTTTIAATLGATTVSYAASGPTVFPHGIASSAPVVTPDGVTQGTIGDTVTKAQGSVQQTDKNAPNGVAGLDANGNVTSSVIGDVSAAPADARGDTVSTIAAKAQGSVQKSDIGLKNSVAPTDANAMMSAPVSGDTSASPATALGATSSRSLASHFGDFLTATDFGVALDGSDQQINLSTYRASLTSPGFLFIPSGNLWSSSPPIGGTAYPQIWFTSNSLWAGQNLFSRFYEGVNTDNNKDTVISNNNGALYINRANNVGSDGGDQPVIKLDYGIYRSNPNYHQEAGSYFNCTKGAINTKESHYCMQSFMTSDAYGGPIDAAANVFGIRNAFSDGKGPRNMLAGMDVGVIDNTGLKSSESGVINALEADLYATGDDDAGNWRTVGMFNLGLSPNAASGSSVRASQGVIITTQGNATYGRALAFYSHWDTAGIDLSVGTSVNNAPALRVGANKTIDFSSNSKVMAYADSSNDLIINTNGVFALSIGADQSLNPQGNVNITKGRSIYFPGGESINDSSGSLVMMTKSNTVALSVGEDGNLHTDGAVYAAGALSGSMVKTSSPSKTLATIKSESHSEGDQVWCHDCIVGSEVSGAGTGSWIVLGSDSTWRNQGSSEAASN